MKLRQLIIIVSLIFLAQSPCARQLPLPVVPDTLTTPASRAEYVLNHFWDAMDWCDTLLTRDDQLMEQSAADFYSVFHVVDSATASTAVAIMLDGASADDYAYKKVAEIARLYLFEPESPVADDETFLIVADRLLLDRKLSGSDLLRTADAKQMAMLNRVGHPAADFGFIGRDGLTSTLREALRLHSRSYLIFYDPDCHVCAELEERLMATDLGDTGVVMISPYGEQDGLWARHAATLPSDWIVGRPLDDDFEDLDLYDLRATPTVLLIDSAATVLSKSPLRNIR